MKSVPLAYPKKIRYEEKSSAESIFDDIVEVKNKNPLYIPKDNSLVNFLLFIGLAKLNRYCFVK